jgi:hypothetical protein
MGAVLADSRFGHCHWEYVNLRRPYFFYATGVRRS